MSVPILLFADSQRHGFLLNSRLGLFSATPEKLKARSLQPLTPQRPHFSRSYVCILPSSLTRVLSHALEYSSRLPVSVCGTVPNKLPLEIISRRHDYARFARPKTGSLLRLISIHGFSSVRQRLAAWTGIPTTGRVSPHASSLRHLLSEVLEYKPVSHRLRFSASP